MTEPRVLVVDDDAPIRALIARVLERTGVQVTVAPDGTEAIRLFRSQPFDAIVLDLMMPHVSGYDVLAEISSEIGNHTAVIVVTAAAECDLRALDGRLVHSVVRKPFDIMSLGDIVSGAAREMAEARAKNDQNSRSRLVEFRRS